LCADAVVLMSAILTWDLNRTFGFALSAGRFASSRAPSASAANTTIHLPAAWLELVLSHPLLQWELHALQSVGHGSASAAAVWSEEAVAFSAALRTLLVQMCGISGKGLKESEGAKHAWAAFCVHGIMAVRSIALLLAAVPGIC
jgi:hypothetical protein